ncbi:MAG: N-acetylmuramoyl-L-alanine amidase [Rhodomicrobium sp.]|nr:N-acetylmuramoyl-L-alanine amidase [Rhodomicrobium sp.]
MPEQQPYLFVPDSPLVRRIVPGANFEARREGFRPDILLLHYTGMPSAEAAIQWLAAPESRVSCHYVIDEAGTVTQIVPEFFRAWHAGVSHWQGVDDINSCSIGIEIQNPGHESGYPDFPAGQMQAVEALCLDITRRWGIKPHRVLAHSDVAPRRKIDPGEKFDWERLARSGIGHWVKPEPVVAGEALAPGGTGEAVMRLQQQLRSYGYGAGLTGEFDADTQFAIAAFQRHFRPALVDGRADRSTLLTLDALLAALPAE